MGIMAGQAEILRSAQRDDIIKRRINDVASQLITSTLGTRFWVKWRHFIGSGSSFAYQALTTLCNLQTLGEEHTGVIHWTEQQTLPSRQIQIIMVLINCFGEQITTHLISRLEVYLNELPAHHNLRPEAKKALLKVCIYARKMIPIAMLLHKTVFYFRGRYYHLSKRTTGVRYRLIRYWLGDRSMASTFHLLGVISLLHLIFTAHSTVKELRAPVVSTGDASAVVTSGPTCPLCLNIRKDTSTTPCGHLFCWDCLLNWVREEPFCPLCRQKVEPSRVVYLQNYSF